MKRERKKNKQAESISIISASAAWSADVNQTDRDVREQRMKGWLQSMLMADSEWPVLR